MTILLQCDKCWLRFATKHKKCPKCGTKITPMRRRYVVEVRDLTGKKHVKTVGQVTPEVARQAEYEFKQEIRSEKPVTITVKSVCMSYIEKTKSLKRVYIDDVIHRLDVIANFFGYQTDAKNITTTQVDLLRGHLLKQGLTKSTVDRYFAAGRAAWNYVIGVDNPWKKAGMFNPDNKITRYLSDEERNRLLVACSKVSRELYEIVFVALGTGLRKSEVLQLRRSQVDFDKQSISLIAKGSKKRLLYPADSVMRLLQDIPDNGLDYFWVDEKGQPHAKYWRYSWHKALKLAGLPLEFRFHDLRHDSATRAYSMTGDIYLVQQLLGHTNISTTMRYAHLEKHKLKSVFGTIDPDSIFGTSDGNKADKS